jgi:hypothetical protein
VHSLRPNVEPVFFKLLIGHVSSYGSLFTLLTIVLPTDEVQGPG